MKFLYIVFIFTLLCIGCDSPKTNVIEPKEEIVIGVVDPIPEVQLPKSYIPSCVPSNDTLIPFAFEDKLDGIKLVSYINMKAEIFKNPEVREIHGLRSLYTFENDLDFSMFSMVTDLDDNQIETFLCTLQSYNQNGESYYGADCYNPRHCIFFLDKKERILGYLELCFQCQNTINNILDFKIVCVDQLNEIRNLFNCLEFKIR